MLKYIDNIKRKILRTDSHAGSDAKERLKYLPFFTFIILLFVLGIDIKIALVIVITSLILFWLLSSLKSSILFALLIWPFFAGFVQNIIVENQMDITFTPSRLFGIVIIMGSAIYIMVNVALKRKNFLNHTVLLFYSLFTFWCLLTLLHSSDVIFAISDFTRLLIGYMVLILVPQLFLTENDTQKILKCMFFSTFILAAYIIVQYLLFSLFSINIILAQYYETSKGVVRMGGVTGAGAAAALLQIGLGINLFLYDMAVKKNKRRIYFISLIIITLAIFFTYARTSLIGVLIFFCLWIIINLKKNRTSPTKFRAILAFIIIGFGIASYYISTSEAWRIRMSDTPMSEEAYTSEWGSGRGALWIQNIDAFKRSSLFVKLVGAGFGSDRLRLRFLGGFTGYSGTHNDYIALLRDVGLIGLAIYLAFIVFTLKLSVDLMKTQNKYYSSFGTVTFLIIVSYNLSQSLFGSAVFTVFHRLYYLVLLGLAISIWRLKNKPVLTELREK